MSTDSTAADVLSAVRHAVDGVTPGDGARDDNGAGAGLRAGRTRGRCGPRRAAV
jgi:hypothetical protein